MTVVADNSTLTTGAYQFGDSGKAGAGTYYLVFSLVNPGTENVWADGTTDDITFTLVITDNAPVSLPSVSYKDENYVEGSGAAWDKVDEYKYTISLDEITDESGNVSAIGFFDSFTATVEGVKNIEVSVHSGSVSGNAASGYSASEAGTYTVTVTLEEGYVWEDGEEITDLDTAAPRDYETIRFALADGYAWPDGTRDDRWYTFVSVNALVAKPDSTTVISETTMTADENDGYLLTGTTVSGSEATIAAFTGASGYYTVTLYDEDMNVVSEYASGSTYAFTAAGTYYLVFSLVNADPANPTNVWADGTTEDITFTLVIGGNVEKPTTIGSNLTADETGLTYTGSVAGSAKASMVPTVSGFWTLAEDGTYALAIDEENTTTYAFFAQSGEEYDAAYTITVNGEDVTYSAAGASGTGTYIVILTLNEGYTWTDGTEGDKTFTFIVYEAVELTFGSSGAGFASEGGTGTEDDPYVYAYDTTATALFDNWSNYSGKLTAYGEDGNEIEDPSDVLADGLTIRFALEDGADEGEQSAKWDKVDEYTYTISLDEITENGTVTAIKFFDNFTVSETGVKNIDVSVHSGSADSSALTTSEAGTYTVTVTLEEGYVWEDGTSDPREYTFIVTE